MLFEFKNINFIKFINKILFELEIVRNSNYFSDGCD